MLPRHLTRRILDALADTPVVHVNGARQSGKSTLAQAIIAEGHAAHYVTLDDPTVFAAAVSDPHGYLSGFEGPVVIDEVQRAPGLFIAIKSSVDSDRRPGRFLLTGSADILLLPRLSESLAGRMEIQTLWPLSAGEIEGVREGFIDAVFADPIEPAAGTERAPRLLRRMLAGGFPEAVSRTASDRRQAWFASYVTTILQRDVRDLANIEGLAELPKLLSLVAARAGGLMNQAELARSSGIPLATLRRYLTLLEAAFLLRMLPAWSGNLGKRLVKAPKPFLADTGLLAHLLGVDEDRIPRDPTVAGRLIENFVVMELHKQAAWSAARPSLHHFRSAAGEEVDIVLENRAGQCVGIEVKSGSTIGADAFKGLRAFAASVGRRFVRGIVLYAGTETVGFAPNLHAMPVSALWTLGATPVEPKTFIAGRVADRSRLRRG